MSAANNANNISVAVIFFFMMYRSLSYSFLQ